jgi:beta-lactamase class A
MQRRSFVGATMALLAAPLGAAETPPVPVLADYERRSGGRIGLFAENVRTGTQVRWRHHERFLMCSSFKASLAACVLSRVDQGKMQLDARLPYGSGDLLDYAPAAKANLERGAMTVSEMCEAAVELSDNTCANVLLTQVGGPAALTAYWRSLGDRVTRLAHHEPELNRPSPGEPDTTSPAAMAGTLRTLLLGTALSAASCKRLTGWMINCKTGGNRLRAGLPQAWQIGDKTGNNGSDAFSDIALAWPRPDEPVVICAFTQGGTPTTAHVESVFAGIGRFVSEHMA